MSAKVYLDAVHEGRLAVHGGRRVALLAVVVVAPGEHLKIIIWMVSRGQNYFKASSVGIREKGVFKLHYLWPQTCKMHHPAPPFLLSRAEPRR